MIVLVLVVVLDLLVCGQEIESESRRRGQLGDARNFLIVLVVVVVLVLDLLVAKKSRNRGRMGRMGESQRRGRLMETPESPDLRCF